MPLEEYVLQTGRRWTIPMIAAPAALGLLTLSVGAWWSMTSSMLAYAIFTPLLVVAAPVFLLLPILLSLSGRTTLGVDDRRIYLESLGATDDIYWTRVDYIYVRRANDERVRDKIHFAHTREARGTRPGYGVIFQSEVAGHFLVPLDSLTPVQMRHVIEIALQNCTQALIDPGVVLLCGILSRAASPEAPAEPRVMGPSEKMSVPAILRRPPSSWQDSLVLATLAYSVGRIRDAVTLAESAVWPEPIPWEVALLDSLLARARGEASSLDLSSVAVRNGVPQYLKQALVDGASVDPKKWYDPTYD